MYASASVSHFCHRTSAHDRCLYRHPRRLRQKKHHESICTAGKCTILLYSSSQCSRFVQQVDDTHKAAGQTAQETTTRVNVAFCQRLLSTTRQQLLSTTRVTNSGERFMSTTRRLLSTTVVHKTTTLVNGFCPRLMSTTRTVSPRQEATTLVND